MGRTAVVLGAVATAMLALAPAAVGGGFATVGLDSEPSDVAAGKSWDVNMTILQHGRTPLDDVQPAVVIKRGDVEKRFAAKPTGEPGEYRASVVFPAAGTWNYEVDDGFSATHTFGPVRIGTAGADVAPPPARLASVPVPADDGEAPLWPWLVAAGAAAALAGAFGARRLRHGHA